MSFDPDTFIHVKIDGVIVHAYPDKESRSVWVRDKKGRLHEFKPGLFQRMDVSEPASIS